jgi:hypothetical protein
MEIGEIVIKFLEQESNSNPAAKWILMHNKKMLTGSINLPYRLTYLTISPSKSYSKEDILNLNSDWKNVRASIDLILSPTDKKPKCHALRHRIGRNCTHCVPRS